MKIDIDIAERSGARRPQQQDRGALEIACPDAHTLRDDPVQRRRAGHIHGGRLSSRFWNTHSLQSENGDYDC